MSEAALREAEREAHLEAAPFALLAAAALAVLAVVSAHAGWELAPHVGWWPWAVTAVAWGVLALVFLTGLAHVPRRDVRRGIAVGLLVVVVIACAVQTGLLVASLVNASEIRLTGPQLLQSGATLWLSNVIAAGLAFWELDLGGPVERAVTDGRRGADFAFPQDGDPELSPPGWAPHLIDYLYVALTNSIAFSPTDTMPLSRRAKLAMALESAVSVVTLLLIAARAINILG